MIDMIQDIARNVRENQVWALSIPPKIPEVLAGTSNGTDHFSLLRLEYSGPALKGGPLSLVWSFWSVSRTEMSLCI
ncbi:MAG: hypothetical protein MI923_11075 [Phycisphaerales bacterium]|nr:hypothetical protein [Phycisphaerales bacterium]